MKLKKHLLTAVLIALPIVAESGAPGMQDPKVRVTFKVEAENVVVHEPVYAVLSIRNEGDSGIQFDLGRNRVGALSLLITPPNGSVVEISSTDMVKKQGAGIDGSREGMLNEGISRVGTISLQRRGTYTQRLVLNKWYGFPATGEYRIELRSTAVFQGANATTSRMEPVSSTLRVGARNEGHLRRIASDLSKVALGKEDYERRMDAAAGLMYMQDPVAVSFLRQLLLDSDTTLQNHGLRGLVAIGNGEAANVFLVLLETTGDERQKAILDGALRRIATTTSDPQLKALIQTKLTSR